MESSHQAPVHSDPQSTQTFPPPPPESGAGQTQAVPVDQISMPPAPPAEMQGSMLQNHPANYSASLPVQDASEVQHMPGPYSEDQAPPLPQRHPHHEGPVTPLAPYDPSTYVQQTQHQPEYPVPPQRHRMNFGDDDPSNPIHYTRDPHKLIAYLVPFPKPQLKGSKVDPNSIPSRFLIYTPAPPPLVKPTDAAQESKLHKVQRKWQEEVRAAKTSTAKTASWQGVKSKVTRGVSKAMSYTTTSNLDFLGRVAGNKSDSSEDENSHDKKQAESETTHKTIGVDEMVLIYPPTIGLDATQMRAEFVNTMLRTKSKAMRDSVISTGLLPVAYGIDILATLVWPFGGLGEIDTVWAYASIRGAKTARSVTKRLSSSSESGDHEKDKLRLNFTPSQRIEILKAYLIAECHKVDANLFPGYASAPLESDVLEAIGWSPRQSGGQSSNWEDEQWETTEVKDDLKLVMHKAAKEWRKWCLMYEKDPVKAMKK